MLRYAYPRSSEGPSPETCRRRSGEWRPAAAARNRAAPGRLGTPPARHYDLAARSSLNGSGGNAGEGSAAPGPKPPRWSAERRARPAGRAPRLRKRGPSRARNARQQKTCAFRRSARPSWGGWNRGQQNPGAATRGGNEGGWAEKESCSADGASSAFTRVFDALWRNPGIVQCGTTAPHCAEPVIGPRFARTRWLHAGYERS